MQTSVKTRKLHHRLPTQHMKRFDEMMLLERLFGIAVLSGSVGFVMSWRRRCCWGADTTSWLLRCRRSSRSCDLNTELSADLMNVHVGQRTCDEAGYISAVCVCGTLKPVPRDIRVDVNSAMAFWLPALVAEELWT